jgi:hypothetical protein
MKPQCRLVAAVFLTAASACGVGPGDGSSTTTAAVTPNATKNDVAARACTQPAVSADLGYPDKGGRTAEFTTNGDPFYITAGRFEHGGIFDPEVHLANVYVGRADSPPTYDQRRDTLTNVYETRLVREGTLSEMRLPAGRYWLASGYAGITLDACATSAITDPKPV